MAFGMGIEWLLAGVLAVWRITHLLALEDGPFDAVLRLRRALGNSGLGHLMDCFYCLSLWVALLAALGIAALSATPTLGATLLLWPALSGGALLLQRATQHADAANEANPPPEHGPKED
jgi:hypothetical protein